MTRLAPTLTTDRLVLRPQTPGDFPASLALLASGNPDDHVNRYDPLSEDTR